jgi:hypothetical protein
LQQLFSSVIFVLHKSYLNKISFPAFRCSLGRLYCREWSSTVIQENIPNMNLHHVRRHKGGVLHISNLCPVSVIVVHELYVIVTYNDIPVYHVDVIWLFILQWMPSFHYFMLQGVCHFKDNNYQTYIYVIYISGQALSRAWKAVILKVN